MQETCPCGSVRGALGNWRPYRDSTMTEEMVGGQHRTMNATQNRALWGEHRTTTDNGRLARRKALLRVRIGVPERERKKLQQVRKDGKTLLTTADLVRKSRLTRRYFRVARRSSRRKASFLTRIQLVKLAF
jgi:hypothetical protein